jgi:hypothetical protein
MTAPPVARLDCEGYLGFGCHGRIYKPGTANATDGGFSHGW